MNTLKDRAYKAKQFHIDSRRKTLPADSDRTDDSFFDFSTPVILDNLDKDHQDDLFHIIQNYLQLPGYRKKLDQKLPRSSFHNETFLTASKSYFLYFLKSYRTSNFYMNYSVKVFSILFLFTIY